MADNCQNCGEAGIRERLVPLRVDHDRRFRTINDRQMFCEHCGNISYVGKQISDHELAVAAAIREMDGLLSAEELQRIRAKYRFRQTDMEQMLSTGPKTWTRWERGKVPQSKATDKLIRLLADDPDVARRLMEQSGVNNPEAAATFSQIEEAAKRIGRALVRAEFRQIEGGDLYLEGMADRVADKAFETARDVRRQAAVCAEAA